MAQTTRYSKRDGKTFRVRTNEKEVKKDLEKPKSKLPEQKGAKNV